jgi:hypothetical protein
VASISLQTGITPAPIVENLSKDDWVEQSIPMRAPHATYRELMQKFVQHFTKEADELGDQALLKELDIINKVSQGMCPCLRLVPFRLCFSSGCTCILSLSS